MKLSAILIVKNEEKKIKGCLQTVGWADEIVVVDTGSSDKTIKIAKRFKTKVIKTSQGSFSDWRNKGVKEAQGDWLLYIDADERVSLELKKEIKEIIEKPSEYSGFAIPRKNFILGQEFKHGGQWPDYVKRLFKKSDFKKWTGQLHEEPIFKGELGHLENPLIHLKHTQLEEMIKKTNQWSEIEARLMLEAHHPSMTISRFITAMVREFWLRMICQKAFLDGPKGIIYAFYQIFSRFVSYAKLWEMQTVK